MPRSPLPDDTEPLTTLEVTRGAVNDPSPWAATEHHLESTIEDPSYRDASNLSSSVVDLPSTFDMLLREVARIPEVAVDAPERVIAGRYKLAAVLGRGAHGKVWEAEDLLTGKRVALKILSVQVSAGEARVRREIAALRVLRLPGVVQLLDEGVEDDRPFLVMERVQGRPFPGVPSPAPWPRVAAAAEALLQTLARVHAVGVIHRDLKPANILVDADAHPTILDFGLARPVTPFDEGITGADEIVGTPAYLAPEQLRDEPSGPAADLYAVGVMLFQALSGQLPHTDEDLQKLFDTRTLPPAPPLRAAAPLTPGHVADLVDRLLAGDPAGRPASAGEALEALLGRVAEPTPPGGMPRAIPSGRDEGSLRALFTGPSRLFHVPEDAARALHLRTGGVPARVTAELGGWVRAGIARADGDRVAIDRDAIDRLEAGLLVVPDARRAEAAELPRLFNLIIADEGSPESLREIAAEALAQGHRFTAAGRLGWATAAVAEGLRAARRLGTGLDGAASGPKTRSRFAGPEAAEARGPLLSLAAQIALAEGTFPALDHALYEVLRVAPRAEAELGLAALLRAAIAVFHRTGRALAALSALPPFADPALERLRQGLRVLAARACPLEQEEAVLAEASRWADASADPAARTAHAGWLGRLRYRQGRFAEAAVLHAEASAGEPWATAKLAALLSSASARMEASQLEQAAATARDALVLARRYRLPLFEARAEWIERAATYRAGAAGGPDRELVEAAALLGPSDIEAMICLNEAAVALRVGDRGGTRELAGRARRAWASLGEQSGGALLAAALALAGGAATPDDEVAALVERALAAGVPAVGVQVLGLIALAGRLPPLDGARVDALAAAVPRETWAARLDVLSVREALDLTLPACRR
jgi:Protein kinase domain